LGLPNYALMFTFHREAYGYILRALRTFGSKEVSSPEAQSLSIRALKIALLSPTHFDFNDLNALPAIQALSDSHPVLSELLEIFLEKELEDYHDFRDEHEDFFDEEGLENDKLHRKMRLLTMASLCASAKNREVAYTQVANALQIPAEEVEMWIIDVIKAGLVEGKLSQQTKTFKIHRNTYRVFGEKQWREVYSSLEQWKMSLKAVKVNLAGQRQAAEAQQERDTRDLERQTAGLSLIGGRRQATPSRLGDMVEMGTD